MHAYRKIIKLSNIQVKQIFTNINLLLLYKLYRDNAYTILFSPRPVGKGVEGLARVGSRAALSFAFAFLRRAWRSGRSTL